MKIVYCVHSLDNSGGIERIITDKANALSKLGYEITIITAEQRNRPNYFQLSSAIKLYDLGINYSENKGLLSKLVVYFFKKRMHKKKLSEMLINIRPDITISTMGNEFLFLYKIKDGSKKFLEIHFAKGYRMMMFRRNFLWRFVDFYRSKQESIKASRYSKFIVLTHEDKESWKGLNNIEVIPNFLSSLPSDRNALSKKICLAVGRLSYQKGFDRLINAWKLIHEKCPDWELHIYGSGELRESLCEQIKGLHLEQTISIFPATKQIKESYRNASIFLFTSRFEGLPMVLLEAMSYGLPTVSFACKCGPRDLIKEGANGFLIQEGDIESFAQKTILLMQDDTKRKEMGAIAFKVALEYSKENIISKWVKIFKSVVKA